MARREDIVAGLIFVPIGAAIPAAAVAQHFLEVDIMAFAGLGLSRHLLGWSFGVLAFALAALNGYLNCIAPRLHERRHGALEDYAHVSGIPIVGGFLVLFAAVLIPPSFRAMPTRVPFADHLTFRSTLSQSRPVLVRSNRGRAPQ